MACNGDHLVFDIHNISELAVSLEPTKQNVVSLATRIYDPLRILSPYVVRFKMLCQQVCLQKGLWDEHLSGESLTQWRQLQYGLEQAQPIVIPRCYFHDVGETSSYCLLGFCDASKRAYAAVVYLRGKSSASNCTADLPSRGVELSELLCNPLWLNRPSCFHSLDAQIRVESEVEESVPEECLHEMKISSLLQFESVHNMFFSELHDNNPTLRCEDFSTLRRLLRVTGCVQKFIERVKAKLKDRTVDPELSASDTTAAELYWIKVVQKSLMKNVYGNSSSVCTWINLECGDAGAEWRMLILKCKQNVQ